jgi:hypothetical protein
MGLDTYAVYPKGHDKYVEGGSNLIPNELFPDLNLCGGMFSGGGNSFRGKAYSSWVEFTTGYSLYEEEIDPESVTDLYNKLYTNTQLRVYEKFNASGLNNYEMSEDEMYHLLKWFQVVVEEGGSVVGWW